MKKNAFQVLVPDIENNSKLRIPQKEAYAKIIEHFSAIGGEREVGIILPVGCGKSGLMTIAPFATKSQRVLLIAPGTRIAKQLLDKDFNPSTGEMFYKKCVVLTGVEYPETAEIRGTSSNIGDLEVADVVITNIQQLQGSENKWLADLPEDFFDLILVDEAHHNVAQSWETLKQKFPKAKIINVSATPVRADGQIMSGDIIYSFPIARAIAEGYIKRLRGIVLSPATLKFVREGEGEVEQEVTKEEVIRLGESDSEFRRSIVTSKETLSTIIDCSIQQLFSLRERTGDNRHKIIASALNYRHCIQITEAYRARGLRADYVHSKEEENTDGILNKLDKHELDVIVQVRKLGEGFDHKFLSVAAICSIFSNLSPFVQFVGRIMRAIDPNDPASLNNQGIVVYHAGANIAQRWSDFKDFSEADQSYFDDLFPVEEVFDFSKNSEPKVIDPSIPQSIIDTPTLKITTQSEILLEEDELTELSPELQQAYELLVNKIGVEEMMKRLQFNRLQPRKQEVRRAARQALNDEVKNAVVRILKAKNINPSGYELDKKHLGKINLITVKSIVDHKIASLVGKEMDSRSEFSLEEIDKIRSAFPVIFEEVISGL